MFKGPSKSPLIQPKPTSRHTHTFLYPNTAPAKDIRRRFFIFSQRRRRRRRSGSGSQRRRGSPRLGGGVSGSPSRLSPVTSRPRLRPPHTGRRPCVRTSFSPPASSGPSTAPGPCGCAARCARPAGSGSQQPLLHQGGRAALGALMPHSEALPVRLVPLFGTLDWEGGLTY